MAFTPDDARDYLLLAAQSALGSQAIDESHPGRMNPRGIFELSDRDAKKLATAVRAWLQDHHAPLFKAS